MAKKTSTKGKKRPVKRKRKQAQIPAPVVMSIPTPSASIKHLPAQAGNRLKLWLAVSLSMAVIILLWAYSLSHTVLSSNTIAESFANSNIDTFVGSVSKSFADFKTTSGTFIEQNETVKEIQESPQQPSTEELDTLFSDIE